MIFVPHPTGNDSSCKGGSRRSSNKRRHTLDLVSSREAGNASMPMRSSGGMTMASRPAPLNLGTLAQLNGPLDPVAEEEHSRFMRAGSLSPKKLKDISSKWIRSSTKKRTADRNSGMSGLAEQVGNIARSLSPKSQQSEVGSRSNSPPVETLRSLGMRSSMDSGGESPKNRQPPKKPMGAPASHKESPAAGASRRPGRVSTNGNIQRLVASEKAAEAAQEAKLIAAFKAQMEAAEREAGETADCEDAYDNSVELSTAVGADDVYLFAPGCTLAEVGEESRIPPVLVSMAGLPSHEFSPL